MDERKKWSLVGACSYDSFTPEGFQSRPAIHVLPTEFPIGEVSRTMYSLSDTGGYFHF